MSDGKFIARQLMGSLRSMASEKKVQDPSIDEEDYFVQISREFLHSFALEVTNIIGLPNGLDVFKRKENNGPNSTENQTKKLN